MGRGEPREGSLIFQFEPEKKKGMSVASKEAKNTSRASDGMNKINQNVESDEMIKMGPNLVSKELAGVQQILKANDEYLKQN